LHRDRDRQRRNTLHYFALLAETKRAIGVSDRPCSCYGCASLTTPRRPTARVALEARAVPHQREVAAFAAGFAFVALGLGFGAALGSRGSRACASVSNITAGVRSRVRTCLTAGEGRVLLLDGTTMYGREIIGNKGASVATMRSLGLPVPPAFVLPIEECRRFHAGDERLDDELWHFELPPRAA